MKTNKLIAIIALGGLVAFGTLVQAQDATNTPPAGKHHRPGGPGGPSGDPKARMDKLTQELGLSADVKTKFDAIMKDQAEQMKALSPEERKTQGKAIREATNDKIKAILTPEQFTKFQELQKNRGGRGGGKPPGGGKPSTPPAN